MDWIYLDNNATTPLAEPVIELMAEAHHTWWANPSSVHRLGQMARQQLELARAKVAKLIGCKPREMVFTSGGTESNNLALKGVVESAMRARAGRSGGGSGSGGGDRGTCVLLTTRVEHSAVREPAEAIAAAGASVVYLDLDRFGRVRPDVLDAAIEQSADHGDHNASAPAVLISIQWVNNETGVMQPIGELADVVKRHRTARSRVTFHVDATQAVGKMPVDAAGWGIDLMTFSAHKFHGPKGIGGLYIRPGVRLRPQQLGGPQEREKRGGTENTPGIIGIGRAAELAGVFVEDDQAIEQLADLRDDFERDVTTRCPNALVLPRGVGRDERIWNTTNIAFPHLEAEAVLLGLSERGVCASAGAACSSGSLEPSPVLLAMGIEEHIAHGAVRFSINRWTTKQQLDDAAEIVGQVVRRLGQTLPMHSGAPG